MFSINLLSPDYERKQGCGEREVGNTVLKCQGNSYVCMCVRTHRMGERERERPRDKSKRETKVTCNNKETCFLFKTLVGTKGDQGRRQQREF